MVLINKFDKKRLEEAGLWKHKREGKFSQESNFSVCNKQHNSRAKTYYIVETFEIMCFLEMWDKVNVMKISERELEILKNKKLINEKNTQKYGEHVERAKCFIARNGDIYISKENKIVSALNN